MEWLVLLGGLTVLLVGGEALVRGATSLARTLGVSSMVIGMTVVAFGTSAPELGVNVAAAWSGRTAITFGNVVGSNIANIGLILGLTAISEHCGFTGRSSHARSCSRRRPGDPLGQRLALPQDTRRLIP